MIEFTLTVLCVAVAFLCHRVIVLEARAREWKEERMHLRLRNSALRRENDQMKFWPEKVSE